jgi:hypothetical protein
MADALQILCIDKPESSNQSERIRGIGGKNPDGTAWYLSLDEAIARIWSGQCSFYVSVGIQSAWVEVEHHGPSGRPFLKTVPDGIPIDNLLDLPACR